MASNSADSGNNELAAGDLGPLAWVLEELRKSLDGASKALRRFVRDAEAARGSNLAEVDASHLRIARQQLHQAVGALEMVGLAAPAKMLRVMEALAQKFVQRPDLCSEVAATCMERASSALTEYLEGVLKRKTGSSVALFPQYKAVAELVGGEQPHPADLWAIEWRWRGVKPPAGMAALAYSSPGVKEQMEQALLAVMRSGDVEAAVHMRVQCMGLAAGQASLEVRTFWMICAAFFESVALGLIPIDVYTKRAASKILRQFATLIANNTGVSESLARELLFFCSLSVPTQSKPAPVLSAVRAAYGLAHSKFINYEVEQFGRFDPAALVLARKRIAAAAETWAALAGGDVNRLKPALEQFTAVADSVIKLHSENRPLARALVHVIDVSVRSGKAPSASVAMEIATAILYLEATYDDLDPADTTISERSERLAQRLEHVVSGGESEPLEIWMEELYRRVSDRQTMGSVVDELRTALSEVEKSLDEFFRSANDKSLLREVPSQLAQMRGVFSVLGLDQPALAALRMRASVEQLMLGEASTQAPRPGLFEKLGNSLGAMGFLIDMLSYQRTLAKKLFVYDEELGEFKPLMGRQRVEVAPEEEVQVIEEISQPSVVETPELAIPEPEPEPEMEEDEDTAELIDIFLEEAREVVENGLAAVKVLERDPSNIAEQTTLRRAYHTLKGSSRMVGLTEFGEAGWSFEQLFNSWLAEHRPATKELSELAKTSMVAFGQWVEDIAAKKRTPWSAQAFRDSADAMRLSGQFVPLRTPGAEPVVNVVPPPPPPPPVARIEVAPVVEPVVPVIVPVVESVELHEFDFVDFKLTDSPPQEIPPLTEVAIAPQPAPEPEPTPEPEPAIVDIAVDAVDVTDGLEEDEDLQVKRIGDLELSTPLYHVYLEEAEGRSRNLQKELQQWVVKLPQQISDTPVILAHSLAGSSATVGFMSLADVARHLEHALLHMQLQKQCRLDHAQVFARAADEICRLLDRFAAGFLDTAETTVLQDLEYIIHTECATTPLPESDHVDDDADMPIEHIDTDAHFDVFDEISDVTTDETIGHVEEVSISLDALNALEEFEALNDNTTKPTIEAATPVATMPDWNLDSAIAPEFEPESEFAVSPLSVSIAMATAAATAAAPLMPMTAAPLRVVCAPQEHEIDAVDQLDDDLLAIFEEEAGELLPTLGAALRKWVDDPSDNHSRTEVLHVLHTLKGSARLTGAMRLGEMAHRMESSIADMGLGMLQSIQIEPLLARFDQIQDTFTCLFAPPAPDEMGDEEPFQESTVADVPTDVFASVTDAVSSQQPVVSTAVTVAPARNTARVQAANLIRQSGSQTVRVRSGLLDRLVNQAGEVMIARARLEVHVGQLRSSLRDLNTNLERLRYQLRDIELQSESQMQSRIAQTKDTSQSFDPLEFDRFTRVQELTRMMAESVHDVATVQRSLQKTIEGAEDDLIAQGRQARELQRDLLRTRMVEFESIAERLYGVVRQSSKETGKQVKLDISGGTIEMDRGMLERMATVFEHILRNSVSHGIESLEQRVSRGKHAIGTVSIHVSQERNDIWIMFHDDGGGLHLEKIRAKAIANGVIRADEVLSEGEAANLIFRPGFSTAEQVTELSGRGVGMDIVRTEVNALGGRIETTTELGKGTTFKIVLPLTTAVTQVVMLRMGDMSIGVPAGLIDRILRVPEQSLLQAYEQGGFVEGEETLPFFWAGALLQVSHQSAETVGKTRSVLVFRSAGQRIALHVDEVLGNQEVVVKNMGPQLSQLPGLAGISVLPSGAVSLIYNPVALAAVYGNLAKETSRLAVKQKGLASAPVKTATKSGSDNPIPLILVVDDSITVRRVTQRLLKREGYRVALATDGFNALEKLQEEKPTLVLSDIEMPRMDGFDLARNIRSDPNLRDLPIIMITSRIATKHKEHAQDLGVDHYLGKPYSEDELLRLIRSYCTEKAAS